MKYFVLLGGNMLTLGTVDKLHEYGYKVLVIDWNHNPAVTGDLHIKIDVKDSFKVIEYIKSSGLNIEGAISFIDLAAPTVNAINEFCGNKVMPDSFNQVLSKERMRTAWQKDKLFNRFSETSDKIKLDDIKKLAIKNKIIIKPNIAASSRGITIFDVGASENDIIEAMDKASKFSFDGKCLIEEFIEGREFTVDMLGDDYGHVCVYGSSVKYHSKNALNNHTSIKLHWNSNIYPEEVWNKIALFGRACYKSIGLKNMFGHLEIIMKDDGQLVPVEIGARSSGFICSHMVSAASGRDYLADYISVLKGGSVKDGHYLNGDTSSMWFGYDIPVGAKSIKESNLTKFLHKDIKVLYSKRDGLKVPMQFGYIIDDNTRDNYGYEMLVGPRDILTIQSVEKAEKQFLSDFLGIK